MASDPVFGDTALKIQRFSAQLDDLETPQRQRSQPASSNGAVLFGDRDRSRKSSHPNAVTQTCVCRDLGG